MHQSPQSLPNRVARTSPYASRVRSTRVSDSLYEVRVDGVLRFLIEGDDQWPAQWQLFAVVDGVRAGGCLALESEHFDVLEQLERGCFWLPAADIVTAPRPTGRSSSVTRYPLPQYLSE
ncbi:hypothetical protein A8H39_00160 [Paraburkholderia fungorum]|uniref:hypothetical protein n=1 Tax=Paraburkholderia fungorum TaxID=134537 RepID=UPI000488CB21|nr:hypothetical protein [Paraburkholderia fungorum]MBB5546519.1 hypothetical protein [Paraburkholderia fungorum]PNE59597.1 hypothetical protein A8H39_00160 [Paraburkholderia fungorum]